VLRALAQLGVIHAPDFDPAWAMSVPDTVGQLSRSPTSVETLERYGSSLVIANISTAGELEPEVVHAARTGGREVTRQLLERAATVLGERRQEGEE
jgi:hypothetical protein